MPSPTRAQVVARLQNLATDMEEIGVAMDYFGGHAEWSQHGREMLGAAAIARQWAFEIVEEAALQAEPAR